MEKETIKSNADKSDAETHLIKLLEGHLNEGCGRIITEIKSIHIEDFYLP